MGVTTSDSRVVRTDRSLSDFMDRYEQFVIGKITYDELHQDRAPEMAARIKSYLSRRRFRQATRSTKTS